MTTPTSSLHLKPINQVTGDVRQGMKITAHEDAQKVNASVANHAGKIVKALAKLDVGADAMDKASEADKANLHKAAQWGDRLVRPATLGVKYGSQMANAWDYMFSFVVGRGRKNDEAPVDLRTLHQSGAARWQAVRQEGALGLLTRGSALALGNLVGCCMSDKAKAARITGHMDDATVGFNSALRAATLTTSSAVAAGVSTAFGFGVSALVALVAVPSLLRMRGGNDAAPDAAAKSEAEQAKADKKEAKKAAKEEKVNKQKADKVEKKARANEAKQQAAAKAHAEQSAKTEMKNHAKALVDNATKTAPTGNTQPLGKLHGAAQKIIGRFEKRRADAEEKLTRLQTLVQNAAEEFHAIAKNGTPEAILAAKKKLEDAGTAFREQLALPNVNITRRELREARDVAAGKLGDLQKGDADMDAIVAAARDAQAADKALSEHIEKHGKNVEPAKLSDKEVAELLAYQKAAVSNLSRLVGEQNLKGSVERADAEAQGKITRAYDDLERQLSAAFDAGLVDVSEMPGVEQLTQDIVRLDADVSDGFKQTEEALVRVADAKNRVPNLQAEEIRLNQAARDALKQAESLTGDAARTLHTRAEKLFKEANSISYQLGAEATQAQDDVPVLHAAAQKAHKVLGTNLADLIASWSIAGGSDIDTMSELLASYLKLGETLKQTA